MTEPEGPFQDVDRDLDGLADRLLKLSLLINVAVPAIVFLVVYGLRVLEVFPPIALVTDDVLQILFYALLLVAVSEVGVAFVLKRAVFSTSKIRPTLAHNPAFVKLVTGATVTLAALGAASMLYGIVLYVLGLDLTRVAIFALITLLHFRLYRPTADFLRELIAQAS